MISRRETMEHSPSFDLNRAIHDWRRGLSKCLAVQRDSLDELESHLRDSIATLMGKELSEEEAFLIAVRRCGAQKQLKIEFSKSSLIESLIQTWFFRTAWILLAFLTFLNGFSLWRGGAESWDVYPIFGLGIPNLMLAVLAVTGLTILQLRYLAKARIHNSVISVLYWFVILAFSGSLILASNVTFDILCGAFLSPNVTSPYSIAQAFSSNMGLSLLGFSVMQILIVLLLLAVSGTSACLRKISGRKSMAISYSS